MSQTISDTSSLLERVAAGDTTAVDACLQRYGGLVWTLASRFCRTRDDAEDATQEIFLEIWQKAGRFDVTKSSESTFISMIARRRLIDRYRRESVQPDVVSLASGEWEIAAREANGLEMSDEAAKAAECLRKLSPDQQRVLSLSIFHGGSHQQIATQLKMPLGTVKSYARRGLIQVRDCMRRSLGSAVGKVLS